MWSLVSQWNMPHECLIWHATCWFMCEEFIYDIYIYITFDQIRHISSIRHLLTTQVTQTLVCSLVLSRLDYCNSLLSGCPQYLLDKLQKVQNVAARLVCKAKKSDHIHPILETLHWLPVTHRIQYKFSTICFNSISETAPQYLTDLLQPYTPARQLRSASDT